MRDIAIGDSRFSVTLSRANGVTHLQVDDNPDRLTITLQPLGGASPAAPSESTREPVAVGVGRDQAIREEFFTSRRS